MQWAEESECGVLLRDSGLCEELEDDGVVVGHLFGLVLREVEVRGQVEAARGGTLHLEAADANEPGIVFYSISIPLFLH